MVETNIPESRIERFHVYHVACNHGNKPVSFSRDAVPIRTDAFVHLIFASHILLAICSYTYQTTLMVPLLT